MTEITTITLNGTLPAPAEAYLMSLRTDVSRAAMRSELNKVARVVLQIAPDDQTRDDWRQVNWATLNAANIRAVMNAVSGSAASRNKTLSALKGVATRAYEANLIDADTFTKIKLVKGDEVQRDDQNLEGRMIEDWELAALMRTCAKDSSPAGIRDGAMIAFAAATGVRRAEVASAMLNNVVQTAESYEVKIIGKRGKVRVAYVNDGAAKVLSDWLIVRGAQIGDDAPVFVNISQTGVIGDRAMSTTALDKMLNKRCAQAGVSDVDWHDLRRTVISKLLDSGTDITIVAQLVGHSSVQTTSRYDRRPAESRRKAARRISVPYYKRSNEANPHG